MTTANSLMRFGKVMDFILDKLALWLKASQSMLLLCLLLYILSVKPAQSAPAVIHDNGKAQPIATLLPEITPELPKQLPSPQPPGDPGAAYMAGLFPIHSQHLSPGTVEAKSVTLNVTQPFFLVGNDPGSTNWLATFCPRLKEIHASGLVVEASNPEQFKAITETCPGLPMAPVNGDGLAKELGISHYPVLVSGRRIEQ